MGVKKRYHIPGHCPVCGAKRCKGFHSYPGRKKKEK